MKTIITLDDSNFDGKYYVASRVEQIDDNGVHTIKYISIGQLLAVLSNSKIRDDGCYCRIGKLPYYYFDGVIKYTEKQEISAKLQMTIPKRKIEITFEGTKYSICFPAIFMYYEIEAGKITNTKVYAIKGKHWNQDTILYNYPFGNVSTQNHKVCWGNNLIPKIESLHVLDIVTSIFFDSPTNNDHYSAKESTKWGCDNLREVFEKLKCEDEFPEEILVPSKDGTIGNFTRTEFI